MLIKFVGEAKQGGARGDGLDRGNKTKGCGEAGKKSRELQLDVWLGNSLPGGGRGEQIQLLSVI